jgi:hypothetical protein
MGRAQNVRVLYSPFVVPVIIVTLAITFICGVANLRSG